MPILQIFVSSTFQDMLTERDLLNHEVLPRLNYEWKPAHTTVQFTDLRWGIDTKELSEQEATQKIFGYCFSEIDKCRPYLLVLIGERYGYIPEKTLLDSISELTLPNDSVGKSVTHMEIDYAFQTLESIEPHYLFCFRSLDNKTDYQNHLKTLGIDLSFEAARVEQLKADIIKRYPGSCLEYGAHFNPESRVIEADGFDDLVFEHLTNQIAKTQQPGEFWSSFDWKHREVEQFLQAKTVHTIVPDDRIQTLLERIVKPTTKLTTIVGQSGFGKTTLMAHLYQAAASTVPDRLFLFVGTLQAFQTMEDVLLYILNGLETHLGRKLTTQNDDPLTTDDLIERLFDLKMAHKTQTLLFLDGIDQLNQNAEFVKIIRWFQQYYPNLKFVVSFRNTETNRSLFELDADPYEISYSLDELPAIIDTIVRGYHKELNEELVFRLIDRKGNGDLLWYQLAIAQLVNLNQDAFRLIYQAKSGMQGIYETLRHQIEEMPTQTREMTRHIIDKMRSKLDLLQAMYLMSFLASSQCGLTKRALIELFEQSKQQWVELEYVKMMQYLSVFFIENDARVMISHLTIAEGILDHINDSLAAMVHHMIADYYSAHFFLEEDAKRHFLYHAMRSRNTHAFVRLIVEEANSKQMLQSDMQVMFSHPNTFSEEALVFYLACADAIADQTILLYFVFTLHRYLLRAAANSYHPLVRGAELLVAMIELLKLEPTMFEEIAFRGYARELNKLGYSDKAEEYTKQIRPVPKRKDDSNKLEMRQILDSMIHEDRLSLDDIVDGIAKMESKASTDPVELFLLSDRYSLLSFRYKQSKDYLKALDATKRSLELAEQVIQIVDDPNVRHKYHDRIYHLGNIHEAIGIESKDPEAFRKALPYFLDAYQKYSVELSIIPDLEKSTRTLSTAIAIVNTYARLNEVDQAAPYLADASGLIASMIQTAYEPSTFEDISHSLLDSMNLMIRYDFMDSLEKLIAMFGELTDYLHPNQEEEPLDFVSTHVYHLIQILTEGKNRHMNPQVCQTDVLIRYTNLQTNVFERYLSIGGPILQYNLIIENKNTADFLYLKTKDFANASRFYDITVELAHKHGLLEKRDDIDEQEAQVIGSYMGVYVRKLQACHQLSAIEEAKQFITESLHPDFASFVGLQDGSMKDLLNLYCEVARRSKPQESSVLMHLLAPVLENVTQLDPSDQQDIGISLMILLS